MPGQRNESQSRRRRAQGQQRRAEGGQLRGDEEGQPGARPGGVSHVTTLECAGDRIAVGLENEEVLLLQVS